MESAAGCARVRPPALAWRVAGSLTSPGGTLVRGGTTAPAATMAPGPTCARHAAAAERQHARAPTCGPGGRGLPAPDALLTSAPSRTVAPMPTSELSLMVHACTVAPCPAVARRAGQTPTVTPWRPRQPLHAGCCCCWCVAPPPLWRHCCRCCCSLTDGDVVADDGGLGVAVDGVLGDVHHHIVLDVGVAAHVDAVHVACSQGSGGDAGPRVCRRVLHTCRRARPGPPRHTARTSEDGAVPDGRVGADLDVPQHVGAGRDEDIVAFDGHHDLAERRDARDGRHLDGLAKHRGLVGRLRRRPRQVGLHCAQREGSEPRKGVRVDGCHRAAPAAHGARSCTRRPPSGASLRPAGCATAAVGPRCQLAIMPGVRSAHGAIPRLARPAMAGGRIAAMLAGASPVSLSAPGPWRMAPNSSSALPSARRTVPSPDNVFSTAPLAGGCL